MTKKQRKMLLRILVAAALLIILSLLPLQGVVRFALFMIPYFVVGYDILRKAVKGVLNRQVFDEDFLMAVATIGAIILGEYAEGVSVMLFFQIGELFQSYAVGKSRRSISQLMDIRPDYANVWSENGLEQVDPDEVEIGTVIVVQPGEKIPIDGTVIKGQAALNTSALTGESIPRDVSEGDEVISGCINLTGLLEIRTTKAFGESTVSKILDLVENASSKKSRSERFISRFAQYYTPIVCVAALAVAVLPPVWNLLAGSAAGWEQWLYRALSFLVISCPCALVISIPLSFFAGIGGASRAGILIKGSNYLEALAAASYVVMDKTGTLTKGVFEVSEIHPVNMSREQLLEYAALAESYSSHPISRSLKAAYGADVNENRVTDVTESSGSGVSAKVDGVSVLVGNQNWLEKAGIVPMEANTPGTVVHVAVDGNYCGYILVTDMLKPNAHSAIRKLKQSGIKKTVMLTGDTAAVAEHVAAQLGLDEVHSGLLPTEKVEWVERLLAKKTDREKLVFVGDGINDAPVLARADIGIAMGALGSDAAIEAADVVLMDDDPMKIATALKIAKKSMAIVYQNIVFSIGIKVGVMIFAAFGVAGMWAAIFADVGVMVLAVLNAMRVLLIKKEDKQ